MTAVRQFMHHDIVQKFLRQKSQPVVKVEISLTAAASPPALLITHRNRAVVYPHAICIVVYALYYLLLGYFFVGCRQAFSFRDVVRIFCQILSSCKHLAAVFLDPPGMRGHKAADGPV